MWTAGERSVTVPESERFSAQGRHQLNHRPYPLHQVIDCDRRLLEEWISRWSDLMEFEVATAVTSTTGAANRVEVKERRRLAAPCEPPNLVAYDAAGIPPRVTVVRGDLLDERVQRQFFHELRNYNPRSAKQRHARRWRPSTKLRPCFFNSVLVMPLGGMALLKIT